MSRLQASVRARISNSHQTSRVFSTKQNNKFECSFNVALSRCIIYHSLQYQLLFNFDTFGSTISLYTRNGASAVIYPLCGRCSLLKTCVQPSATTQRGLFLVQQLEPPGRSLLNLELPQGTSLALPHDIARGSEDLNRRRMVYTLFVTTGRYQSAGLRKQTPYRPDRILTLLIQLTLGLARYKDSCI